MRKILSIFSLMLIYVSVAFGQAAIDIPVLANDGSVPNPIETAVGLDLTATNGIDVALGEAALPPLAPGLDVRFEFAGVTSYKDYRPPTPLEFPFTGIIQHVIILQASAPGLNINLEFNLPTGAALTIKDQIGGSFLNIGPFTGPGVAVIPFEYLAVFGKAYFIMDYTNIGPPAVAPIFSILPASLDFGAVGVGLPSTPQTATVTNTGTAPLDIASAIPSDLIQYDVVPNPLVTYPIIIAPGGTYDFDVTFTPAALGTQSRTIDFTHNATTTPDLYPVTGVGADAGPTFGVTPTSLHYGVVLVGLTPVKTLTVTNNGLSNTLNISSVSVADPVNFSVTPTNATILPGGNEVFTVTFAPTIAGPLTGDVTFLHDGPGPSSLVPVDGEGYEPPAVNGLVFDEDTAFVSENTIDITQPMHLLGQTPGIALHALQFRLLTNDAGDDETILTFQSLAKSGTIASNPDWILETNVARGPITANGASKDTIYVLLYNIGSGGLTGDWSNLLQVTYKTAVLPPLTPSQKSSFTIFNAEGSTVEGNYIDITPSDPVLEVIVEAAGGTYGDVNGDGCVDILDLIMVVDHIVGRDSLTGGEFDRADLAPWPGTPEPVPDGFVNVQDLSVLQSIILTGFYPNGDPVTPCGYLAKGDGASDATVTLYINEEGITAYVDADIGIRGAQIEFGSVSSNPENMVISTPLGQGYYFRVNELLRTLMYDRAAQQYIDAGVNNFMADMPFTLTDPQDVSVAKIVLVDINTKKLGNIVIRIVYGTPTLPLDYILFQNYPNPFNPSTSVKFQVPKTSDVTITIYDMLGQAVKTLFAGEVMRGNYTVDWDGFNNSGSKVASGTYIYRMTAGEFMQAKKMVYVK